MLSVWLQLFLFANSDCSIVLVLLLVVSVLIVKWLLYFLMLFHGNVTGTAAAVVSATTGSDAAAVNAYVQPHSPLIVLGLSSKIFLKSGPICVFP